MCRSSGICAVFHPVAILLKGRNIVLEADSLKAWIAKGGGKN